MITMPILQKEKMRHNHLLLFNVKRKINPVMKPPSLPPKSYNFMNS